MNNNDRVCRGRGGLNEDMIRRLLGGEPPVSSCAPPTAEKCPVKTPRALATVKPVDQKWEDIYGLSEALIEGTIFEQLNLQFTGRCHG